MRSRTVSLPAACWRSTFSAPPICAASSVRRRSSSSSDSQLTEASVARPLGLAPVGEPIEHRQHRYRVPPGATEVLLVRHGESAPADPDKPFPLVDGHGDPPLDPVGEEEAERLANRLAGERIDAIYVTSLCRTAQTAAPLAKRLGIEPRVEPDLREVFLGEWEGG